MDILPNYDGVMSMDDLRNHTSAFDTPASVDYRGHTVWEMPPNCQGIIALMILNILEGFDLEGCIAQSHEILLYDYHSVNSGREYNQKPKY